MINSLGGSGGAEHGLVREATRLSGDTEQKVVRLFEKDHLEAGLGAAGIEVEALGLSGSRAGWNWPLAVWRLRRVIETFRPDVLHSSLFTANLVAQLAGRVTGVPVLSTFTLSGDPGLLKRYQPGAYSWRGTLLRWMAAMAARRDKVHFRALTQDALETNCQLLGVDPSRATVIPRGIDPDLFPPRPKSREELGLPNKGQLLVNVGRQTAQKGHLSLLEAFTSVRREVDAHLAIVGREGDATEQLRSAVVAHGLEHDVTLVGYTPEAYHYMANADAFVFSSFMEGLGTAVLEAMAMGIPVVAYDIPPVREITDDGRYARLVDLGDPAALAAVVLETLSRDEEPVDTKAFITERYAIQGVAEQVEALLEAVARS